MSNLKYTPASNGVSAGPLGTHQYSKFTPALSVIEGKRAKDKYKEFDLTWWEENSFFKYDSMLCSAFYGMADRWNYREDYKIPKDFLLIADSGGFEQATQGVRIEAIDVLKWQENNADIALTLDIPPVNPENLKFTEDQHFFEACAKQSLRNAECAQRNRKNIKLYNVLQGHTIEQLDFWSQKRLNEFDGTALSHKSKFLVWLSVQAMYAKEQGVQNIHVLTGTGYNSVPIIVYLKKHFKTVTFDSSSYGMGARRMQYNLPYRYHIFFGRNYNNKIKTLPCDCPICQNITIEDLQSGTSVAGALLSLHNLYNYIQHVEFLNTISDDEELFTNYINRHTNQRTRDAINFIKSCEEIGFIDTYKKFNLSKPTLKKTSTEDWFT